jgi:hypothetical protein
MGGRAPSRREQLEALMAGGLATLLAVAAAELNATPPGPGEWWVR